jgi:5-methylcytosine-specific restriction enzyme A
VSAELEELVEQAKAQIEAATSETLDPRWEGAPTTRLVNKYKRNPYLRAAALAIHGTDCQVCRFSFSRYGSHGAGFIEVHHLKPLAQQKSEALVNPRTDMAVLCANCHRMIHRHPDERFTLDQLRALLDQYWSKE